VPSALLEELDCVVLLDDIEDARVGPTDAEVALVPPEDDMNASRIRSASAGSMPMGTPSTRM
jgi:hypothetical protein